MKNIEPENTEYSQMYYNALLATVPSLKGSKRCGKGSSCEHYNKHNRESGCKVFNDRRKCTRSNKQRRKSANSSKRKQYDNWYCC